MKPPVAKRPLFLLDYDGTLAEITEDPEQAVPYRGATELLRELLALYPLRLITGRRVADLARLVPIPHLVALGVHGMEEGTLSGDVGSRISEADATLLDEVRGRLPSLPGMRVEDKVSAIALHYRGAAHEERTVAALREWTLGLPDGLDSVWGKKVVEVRPNGYDKGRSAVELAQEHPDTTPVMIGDDTTDEDAFRALSAHPYAITIKVGAGETQARYRLADIEGVLAYLQSYLNR